MSFDARRWLTGGAAALALLASGLPGDAQVVESGGLGQIDPWGAGYISRGQGAFSSDLWSGSATPDLIPLMRNTATGPADRILLTPAEHNMLRRALLSAAARPQGEDSGEAEALLTERIRMLIALGEVEPAIDLMRRTGDPEKVAEAERMTIDMALARGDIEAACAGGDKGDTSDAFYLKLRAVCFALGGDEAGAELAIELAANAGVDDPWLFSAVFAAVIDTPEKPPARLKDGLSITASLAGGLKAPINVMDGVAPHYALALAGREALPAEWRVLAAGISAEAGLADPQAIRKAFASLVNEPDYAPGSAIERAMQVLNDKTVSPADRARAFSDALRSAEGRPERYASVSAVLAPGIEDLPKSAEIAPRALVFARAALARGDVRGAARWSAATEFEGVEPADAFDLAFIDAMILIATENPDDASAAAIADRLIEDAGTAEQKVTAARVLACWSALGIPLDREARELLALHGRSSGTVQDAGEMLRYGALTQSDTAAELILRTIRMTAGQPWKLSTRDIASIVETLTAAGLQGDARAIALEALQYWES